MRIKNKDIEDLRVKIAAEQNNLCWLCDVDLNTVTPCLDHDHQNGAIRGVLCQNCNGIEGKIANLANRAKREKTRYDFLNRVLRYWNFFSACKRDLIHPSHKTADEKRLLKNKRARQRRKKVD